MLREGRRIVGGESAEEGLLRLEQERMADVSRDISQWSSDFCQNIDKASKLLSVGGMSPRIINHPTHGTDLLKVNLMMADRTIAHADVTLQKRGDDVEAVLTAVQGKRDEADALAAFEEGNQHLKSYDGYVNHRGEFKWFLFLAQSVVAAAHDAGVSWVRFPEVTQSPDYKNLSFRDGTPEEIRGRMRTSTTKSGRNAASTGGKARSTCGISRKLVLPRPDRRTPLEVQDF